MILSFNIDVGDAMDSGKSTKGPKYFQRKSVRLLQKGNLHEAIAVVKARLEHHSNDITLKKWLEVIKGYMWVIHLLGSSKDKAITRDEAENIIRNVVEEILDERKDNKDDIPMEFRSKTCWPMPLDIQGTNGVVVYGIECHECKKKLYIEDRQTSQQLRDKHVNETGHKSITGLAIKAWEEKREEYFIV